MKICIISEQGYGNGAAIASYRLAKSLSKDLANDVFYIFYEPGPGIENVEINKYPLIKRKHNFRCVSHSIKNYILKRINKNFYFENRYNWCFSKISRLIDTIKPDIINLHNVGTILRYKDIIALSKKVPIIWTMHDAYAIKSYSFQFKNNNADHIKTSPISSEYIDQRSRLKLLKGGYPIQFITPSKWLRHNVLSEKVNNKKIHVIPNGLSKRVFSPDDKRKVRQLFELDPDGFYLLFVASNLSYERKNLQSLLTALRIINDSSIKLLAIGNMNKKLKKQYKNIYCFPSQFNTDYLRKIYACANLFVITSLIDNLPNTVLESMFCGVPVIGSNTGGIPEMVIPDRTGYLFDPYSPSDLARTIVCAKQNKEKCFSMGEKSLNFALNTFSIETQKERYLKLFKKTANEFKSKHKKEMAI